MLPIDFQETSTLNKLEHDNSEDSSTAMVRVYQPPVVNTTSTRSLTSGSQQPLNGFRVSNNTQYVEQKSNEHQKDMGNTITALK